MSEARKEFHVSPKKFSSLVNDALKGCAPENSVASGVCVTMPEGVSRCLKSPDGHGGFITYYENPSIIDC